MPNDKGSRRRFGAVRKLPSGRWQARYPGPDGAMRPADKTFASKTDAEVWLSATETDMRRGDWIDPEAGKLTFRQYATSWLNDHVDLSPKTRQLYEGLLRLHLFPTFGEHALTEITPASVRRWRAERLKAVGASTVAKAYRLLRAVLNTAVTDELIRKNPCQIEKAGIETPAERPTLSVAEVYRLADAITSRYRMLVLLAGFCGLRWGELAALRRNLVDLDAGTVKVEVSVSDLKDGSRVTKGPKSEAGKRTVHIPAVLLPELRLHMDFYAEQEPKGLVFVGPKGAQVRRSTFTRPWRNAVTAAGLEGLHFHDLRHTANTLASETGATLKELMARMGHASTKAALRYLHQRDGRDKKIADGMSREIAKEREPKKPRKKGKKQFGEPDEQDSPAA